MRFSLLLRFTDDTFDPELAATIGKFVLVNKIVTRRHFLEPQTRVCVCLSVCVCVCLCVCVCVFVCLCVFGRNISFWANITSSCGFKIHPFHLKPAKQNGFPLLPFFSHFSLEHKRRMMFQFVFMRVCGCSIINLVSDQVTLPWICCFCSANNGWRSSMSDIKSEPYP